MFIILLLVYRRIIMNSDVTLKSALVKPHEALVKNQAKINENKAKLVNNNRDLKVSIEIAKLGSQNLAIVLVIIPIISAFNAVKETGKATLTFVAVVLCVPQALDLIYGHDASRPEMSLKVVYAHVVMVCAYVGSTVGTPLAGLVNTDWVIELNQKLKTDFGQIGAAKQAEADFGQISAAEQAEDADQPPPLEPIGAEENELEVEKKIDNKTKASEEKLEEKDHRLEENKERLNNLYNPKSTVAPTQSEQITKPILTKEEKTKLKEEKKQLRKEIQRAAGQAKMAEQTRVATEKRTQRQAAHQAQIEAAKARKDNDKDIVEQTPTQIDETLTPLETSATDLSNSSSGTTQIDEAESENVVNEQVEHVEVKKNENTENIAERKTERKTEIQKQKDEAEVEKAEAQKKRHLERNQADMNKAIAKSVSINTQRDEFIKQMDLIKAEGARAANSDLAKEAQDKLQLISNKLQTLQDDAQTEVDKNSKTTDSYQVPEEVKQINIDIFNAITETRSQVKKTKNEVQLIISTKIAEEKLNKADELANMKAYQNANMFQRRMHDIGLKAIKT